MADKARRPNMRRNLNHPTSERGLPPSLPNELAPTPAPSICHKPYSRSSSRSSGRRAHSSPLRSPARNLSTMPIEVNTPWASVTPQARQDPPSPSPAPSAPSIYLGADPFYDDAPTELELVEGARPNINMPAVASALRTITKFLEDNSFLSVDHRVQEFGPALSHFAQTLYNTRWCDIASDNHSDIGVTIGNTFATIYGVSSHNDQAMQEDTPAPQVADKVTASAPS